MEKIIITIILLSLLYWYFNISCRTKCIIITPQEEREMAKL
jgi:hypothetical protein